MNHLFVVSQYFSTGLNQHIKDTYNLDQFQGGSLSLLNPEERPGEKIWYKGTADAVRKHIDDLTKLPIDYFLILSGDQLYNMDLEAMVSFAYEKEVDLTIAALPVGHTEASRLGILKVDNEAIITDFHEKPKDPEILKQFEMSEQFIQDNDIHCSAPPCFLASMGIYVFKKEALISLLREDDREDFGKHIIPTHLKKGKAAAFLHQGYWEDIGTISSFYNANLSLTTNSLGLNLYNEVLPIYAHNNFLPGARFSETQVKDSIICEGAIVEAKEITHSIIGVRSTIKKGSVIRDSILLGNEYYSAPEDQNKQFTIGRDCHIEKAIIDENVTIGDNVRLTNAQKQTKYDGDGIYIRDGIIIVPSGSILPNNFTL